MTKDQQTSHDFDKTREWIEKYFDQDENKDAAVFALKLAKIVTGEPSEGIIRAACPAIEEWIGHPEAEQKSKERWLEAHRSARREQFKAMIAEAIKEIER